MWSGEPHRVTWDLDLLGFGEGSPSHVEEVFRGLCRVQVEEDGLEFVESSVRCVRIREDQLYEGVRVLFLARLGEIPIPIQVDLAFGDAVVPASGEVTFPAMLDLPAPCLRAYPRETVVAEKFQAMVLLGLANSRMKDFYDVWILARRFQFDGEALCAAIQATFACAAQNAASGRVSAGFDVKVLRGSTEAGPVGSLCSEGKAGVRGGGP